MIPNISKILTLLAKFPQTALGQGASDLQTFGHDRGGDQLVGGHFLVELLVGGLIEEDLVVELIANLSLGPLLLLGLATSRPFLLLLGLLRLLCRSLGILLRRLKRKK